MSNTYDPEIHHRRSIRLKNYNYSGTGVYFITICTNNNENLFGELQNQQMLLNDAGKIIDKIWNEIHLNYTGIKTDIYQVMPDHFHGIIIINSDMPVFNSNADDTMVYDLNACNANKKFSYENSLSTLSLADTVKNFKTLTTKLYSDGVKEGVFKPFNQRLWQRNYWEHIIRNEEELTEVRKYIINNPKKLHLKESEEYDFLKTDDADSDRI